MKFRYARHTNNLRELTGFYTAVLGLEKLGGFENHSGYNGVFLGLRNRDWHLEFTESADGARHTADEDDLIVFYLASKAELEQIVNRAKRHGIPVVSSKNPYWQKNGVELRDPDNFGVILTVGNRA